MTQLPRPSYTPNAAVAERFVRDTLGWKPWGKQLDIIRAVFGPNRVTVVRSCHGAGKTASAARIALAWLYTAPYRSVITTAPTARQVSELLWKEIRIAYRQARQPLGGELPPAAPVLRVDDGWLAIGFSSDNPVNFHGWHCRGGTLVILDEACGVDPGVWEALQGVLTGAHDRLLAIGNPTVPHGPFYDHFRDASPHVNRLAISALDVPQGVDGLVTTSWIEDRKREWGESSPMYQSRVLGNFPTNSTDALVPMAWVEAAQKRWASTQWTGPYTMGVDLALDGPDFTVVAVASPQGVRSVERLPKVEAPALIGHLVRIGRELNPVSIRVDADGMGGPMFDFLAADPTVGFKVVAMRGGGTPRNGTLFANNRAEWFYTLRERMNPSQPNAMVLPPSDLLAGQLCSIQTDMTLKGQIKLESKREMSKSPDEADAVAYACAVLAQEYGRLDMDLGHLTMENPWRIY